MQASDFPANMPEVWRDHWADVAVDTGTPVLLGEWGGVWEATGRGSKRPLPSTVAWQHELRDFLVERNVGFFCAPICSLNHRLAPAFSWCLGTHAWGPS